MPEPDLPASDILPGPAGALSMRVLVVDDSADAALSMAMLLQVLGCETATAGDGGEALRMAESFRPEVVLLDIGLPDISGLEVAKRIAGAAWGAGMTLIALTGWSKSADKDRSRDAGCKHHLVKPVDPDELTRLLQRIQADRG